MGKEVGAENLLTVWAILLSLATLTTLWTARQRTAVRPLSEISASSGIEGHIADWREGWDYLRRSSLIQTLVLVTVAQWIVFTLVDFLFNAETGLRFHNDKETMAQFFGVFRGFAGLTALVLQVFVATPLHSSLGVGKTVLVHPAFMVLATGGMQLLYGFVTNCIAKFGDHVLLYTIQESSYQLLYNPVPLDHRGRMRAFVEGYIKPASMGLAGLTLALATLTLSKQHLVAASVVSSIIWLILAGRLGFTYFEALVTNLSRSPDIRAMTARQLSELRDAQTMRVLVRQLASEDEEAVIFALEIMGRIRAGPACHSVEEQLRHPSARVRVAAVDALRRMQMQSSAAAVALTRTATLDGILRAVEAVREMLRSKEPADRATGASILGRLKTPHFTPSLLPLIEDPDPAVQGAAIRALGDCGDLRALPVLLEKTRDRTCRYRAGRSAMHIVSRYPEDSVPHLLEALEKQALPSVQAHIIDLLGICSHESVIPFCLRCLHAPDTDVHTRALMALGRQASKRSICAETVREALRSYAALEIQEMCQLLQARNVLQSALGTAPVYFLAEAIETAARETGERLLLAVGLLSEQSLVRMISHRLHSMNPRDKADAIEALDNLRLPEITRPLLATLDPSDPGEMLHFSRQILGEQVRDLQECLDVLLSHAFVWVRAVTAFFIGQQSFSACEPRVKSLLQDPSGVVRETALFALYEIRSPDCKVMAEQSLHDLSPRVRALAQRLLQESERKGKAMLSTIEKILFLKTVSFFSTLSGGALRDMADLAIEEDYPAGTVLYRPNDAAESLYIIVRGRCSIQRESDGTVFELAELGARDCAGEMSLLDGEPHTTTAILTEDSALLMVTREAFRELIKEDPDIAFDVFKELSRRHRQYRDIQEFRHAEETKSHVPSIAGH